MKVNVLLVGNRGFESNENSLCNFLFNLMTIMSLGFFFFEKKKLENAVVMLGLSKETHAS